LSGRTLEDIRDLLVEVRDLLLPVADSHRADYNHRNAVRGVLSTDKRRAAWALADGTLTQTAIASRVGIDQGGASKFFKSLRELDAIVDDPNPRRTVEV